jgi:aconitate hydratase 2/2-methylisocitrate dehydratase
VCAQLGRIPTPEEYLKVVGSKISGNEADLYRYLSFDTMARYAG